MESLCGAMGQKPFGARISWVVELLDILHQNERRFRWNVKDDSAPK